MRTLQQFVDDASVFLEGRVTRRARASGDFSWGDGSDDVSIVEEKTLQEQAEEIAAARAWACERFDAGFGWIDGPQELGGAGLDGSHKHAYRNLERRYEVPDQSCLTIGLGMVAPTIAAHATEKAKVAYLSPLHRGDILACQLFSEPGAGSDLASVSTRAERDGDEWIVNGQKVWSSNAQFCDIGEIICRTNPDAPKHRGLSAFIVDMDAPGVEVRPLRQMTGGAGFNEVFLEDVRIPDDHRLGEVDGGWSVALTTLLNERASIGSGMGLGPGPGPFQRLVELLRRHGDPVDPVRRQELAALYASERISAWTLARGQSADAPGPELSILKLRGTRHLADVADHVGRVLGPRLAADTGEWGTYAWGDLVCGVPGARLGGGTDEVLRNIVAERVLGLPKEPGIDNTTPFKDLSRN